MMSNIVIDRISAHVSRLLQNIIFLYHRNVHRTIYLELVYVAHDQSFSVDNCHCSFYLYRPIHTDTHTHV